MWERLGSPETPRTKVPSVGQHPSMSLPVAPDPVRWNAELIFSEGTPEGRLCVSQEEAVVDPDPDVSILVPSS